MEQPTNELQAQALGVSSAEMPEAPANVMPEVQTPKMVPEEDLRRLQAVKDKEIAERSAYFEAQLQAVQEQARVQAEALQALEAQRIAQLDPDERTAYDLEQLRKENQRMKADQTLAQARQWAIGNGLPADVAMKASDPYQLNALLAQYNAWQAQQIAADREAAKQEKELQARAATGVDKVIPAGGSAVDTSNLYGVDRIANALLHRR